MEKNHCYYLEGTDGVGKDVIGTIISQKRGAKITKLVLCSNNPWDFDRTGEIPSSHPLFPVYLLKAIIWDILHFELTVDQLQISLIGPRSAAWGLARNECIASVFLELLKYYPSFDSTVLLQASIDAKKFRLIQRANATKVELSAVDQLVFTEPKFVSRMDKILAEIICQYFKGTVIDTTTLSICETHDLVSVILTKDMSLNRYVELDRKRSQLIARLDFFNEEILKNVSVIASSFVLSTEELSRVKTPIILLNGGMSRAE